MNCLEFRRQILTDPRCREIEFLRHRERCLECAPFVRRVGRFEQHLEQAMRVDVPADLASRIRLKRSILEEQRIRRQRPWRYAMAAGVAFVLGTSGLIGYRMHHAREAAEGLRNTVLQHIAMEPQHLRERNNIPVARLNQLLAPFGAQFSEGFGNADYAGSCAIGKQLGAHFVIHGQTGPVTIIYVPGKPIAGRSDSADRRFASILLPAGDGNLAIVGERGESLDSVLRKVTENLTWTL